MKPERKWTRPRAAGLATLKERLLREQLPTPSDPHVRRLLLLAATEAEALAWQTAEPLLLLPALLDEKLEGVRRYAEAQQALNQRVHRGIPGPAPPDAMPG